MPAAFFRPISPGSARDFFRTAARRFDNWSLRALNAQPWGRHTPTV